MSYRRALPAIKVSLGRERVTRAVGPSEAGYIANIRAQIKRLSDNMKKQLDHIHAYTPEAIRFALEPIYDESQRLVPVDTGDLKRSGFVGVRTRTRAHTVVLGYGIYGRPHYAAMVHERLDFRHAAPTQAKYLEQAIATKGGNLSIRINEYMTQVLGGKKIG